MFKITYQSYQTKLYSFIVIIDYLHILINNCINYLHIGKDSIAVVD